MTMARARSSTGSALIGRYCVAVVVALLVVVTTVACGGGGRQTPSRTRSAVPGYQYLNPLSVDDLLKAITNAGLDAPNPRDVTGQECPAIGCTNMLQTDTVSIIKFATPGKAELYAGSTHNVFQIEDVVLKFPPSVPKEQQRAYGDAVKRAII